MKHNMSTTIRKALAIVAGAAFVISLGACGSSGDTSDATKTSLDTLKGVSASGDLGSKPKVTFDTPLEMTDGAYATLQQGDGASVEDGQRLCVQTIAYNATTGEELGSTWESGPDCAVTVNSTTLNENYYKLLKGAKLGTTFAFGVVDSSTSSGSSSSAGSSSGSSSGVSTGSNYLYIITLVSASKDYDKATGDKVTDIPADLPKVTLDGNGKPSIDMNGYQGSDKLVVQTLIKGKGDKVTDKQTVKVKYSGWLLDGTQFDSSWERSGSDSTLEADTYSGGQHSVITGWQQGLVGQTVGSQVLLVIPPDLGYGGNAQGSIPANSTLVFVVDILAAY